MRFLQPKFVFLAVMIIGLMALARAQSFYGTIYHGWDAQFYYSLAHSFVFDQDYDVTNNMTFTPAPQPFDRDGDGYWEAVPRRADGAIPTKYPLGLSLV